MMIRHGLARPGSDTPNPAGRLVPRRARRGITIIEVMVVMAGVATMLGLCAVTIQLLFRLYGDAQARLAASVAMERLASQFREDVHACDDARFGEKAAGGPATGTATATASLRLSLGPQRVVTYEARDGRVARVESGSATTNRHESYLLDGRSAVRFEVRDDGPRRFMAMVVDRHGGVGKRPLDPPRPLEVLALRGKHRIGPSRPEGGQPR
jgi:hypothetical protein